MEEILVKYLLGEATVAEQLSVDRWLREEDKNRRYFEQFKTIWDASKQLDARQDVDVQGAWERFNDRLVREEQPQLLPANRRSYFNFSRMAAAAVIVLALGYYFYYTKAPVVLVAQQQVVVDTLPDRSVVTLNKASALRYQKSFNKKNRKVSLEGEAFFEITANKDRPFEIEINDVQVKVVGTSFNVKNKMDATEVIVETGIVQVLANGRSMAVHPGQKIIVDKDSGTMLLQSNQSQLYNYYRTHELICNNTPLSQLVEALNDAYGSHIIIANPATAQMKITTRFKQGSLNDILDVIAATLNLEVVRKSEQIIIQ